MFVFLIKGLVAFPKGLLIMIMIVESLVKCVILLELLVIQNLVLLICTETIRMAPTTWGCCDD